MTLPTLPENIILTSSYDNITSLLEADLETIARNHLIKFADSYLKPYLQKENAIVRCKFTFTKNKKEKYEGVFHRTLDGHGVDRHTAVPFKEPIDVINHAFKHLKEHLANK